MRETIVLIQHEFTREFRNRTQLSASLLYLISCVFIAYIAFQNQSMSNVWSALFWIIVLFGMIQTSAKSFDRDRQEHLLYLGQLCSPHAYILSKMVFNAVLSLAQLGIAGVLFILFFDITLQNISAFVSLLAIAGLALSLAFTFTSAIASKGENSTTLASILGLPIILPTLLVSLSAHKLILKATFSDVNFLKLLAAELGLGMLALALAYILIPYLWRD